MPITNLEKNDITELSLDRPQDYHFGDLKKNKLLDNVNQQLEHIELARKNTEKIKQLLTLIKKYISLKKSLNMSEEVLALLDNVDDESNINDHSKIAQSIQATQTMIDQKLAVITTALDQTKESTPSGTTQNNENVLVSLKSILETGSASPNLHTKFTQAELKELDELCGDGCIDLINTFKAHFTMLVSQLQNNRTLAVEKGDPKSSYAEARGYIVNDLASTFNNLLLLLDQNWEKDESVINQKNKEIIKKIIKAAFDYMDGQSEMQLEFLKEVHRSHEFPAGKLIIKWSDIFDSQSLKNSLIQIATNEHPEITNQNTNPYEATILKGEYDKQ